MSAEATSRLESGVYYGRVLAIQRRRRLAMAEVLKTFEATIQPLLPAESTQAVDNFKGVVRKKINGLAAEAQIIAEAEPGQDVSALAADLTADLIFETEESETT